ncbi:MAG: 16S rRNA (cytidine(1402)-2'-O)-methyltransferase [Candidatus Spechtbacterales bacterium]|nr:16S rRNA (cytidine(1402)-2'-O)-methyltransferase [Candidatus Spechtbacterales bacterium]
MSKLFIVATPIGNLQDITLRALHTLKESDFILCEDTRVTKKLLNHYEIDTPTISYHHHSSDKKTEEILQLLKEGKTLSLATDAGTPGISDPGNELIATLLEDLGDKLSVAPIPGPSALTAAASISAMPMNEFIFLGYPPKKRKRKKFFERVVSSDIPVILYESVHRIIKTLEEIEQIAKDKYDVMVAREITKQFESIYRGTFEEVLEQLQKDKVKGEFVIILREVK